jgi:hypothetical protein
MLAEYPNQGCWNFISFRLDSCTLLAVKDHMDTAVALSRWAAQQINLGVTE